MFSNFIEILSSHGVAIGDQNAFIYLEDGEIETDQLTFAALDRRARAIAAVLQQTVGQGERALLLLPHGLEFISAFFGCLYAGVVAVPAYPPRQKKAVRPLLAIASDAQPSVVLTTRSVSSSTEVESEMAGAGFHIGSWIRTDEIDTGASIAWQELNCEKDCLAFLQYTSGSTGVPKGVMVTHGNLLVNMEMMKASSSLSSETVFASWLPLFHDMGLIGNVLLPVYLGAKCILMSPAAFIQKPVRWLQAITKYGATMGGAPNFAYDLCSRKVTESQKESLDLSSWRLSYIGAEPISVATINRFATTFASCGYRPESMYPGYGLAEATLFVSGGLPTEKPAVAQVDCSVLDQRQVKSASNDTKAKTLVGCGQSWLNQQIVIVDPETCRLCTQNQVGEIWVSGPNVALGYWNRPEETQQAFHAKINGRDEQDYLRTGDLGFFENGQLFVTGRIKDLIIIHGRNYYPQDIEATVESSNAVFHPNACAAFSIDADGEEKLIVVCEVKLGAIAEFNSKEIFTVIRQAIAEEHDAELFGAVFIMPSTIPRTSSGKIRRSACRDAFLSGSTLKVVGEYILDRISTLDVAEKSQSPYSSPEIKAWLIGKVAEYARVTPSEIDPRDPFTRYGLDSQKAVALTGELQDFLKKSLPVTLVYDFPSIESLSRHLSGELKFTESAETSASPSDHAIAIIGMGCRFPGAKNPEGFWRLLRDGVDTTGPVPRSRWNTSDLDRPVWGAFIDEVDQFDPEFFGISPREAEMMDPQQRLLLEVAWEALENAGIPAGNLAGTKTGVYIGISSFDYSRLMPGQSYAADPYFGTGNALSIAANRLSYIFDLRGPSLAIDTACSSSLAAVHQACRSLRAGDSELAIAGGVNLILTPELTMTFSQAGMMSPDGKCKSFDADANGYVRGEGCGVVILKRLSDALRDRDNIISVIRGTAVNQDGKSNGLTAPNGPSQQAVIREALLDAGLQPSDVTYVEAHGTGTPLGDPIEMNSIKEALCGSRGADDILWVGSVKTNLGHLEAAAGIAGLIKLALAIRNGQIPAHLHLNKLNPYINLDEVPIRIPTSSQAWVTDRDQRVGGISSFGFGGTNVHAILQGIDEQQKAESTPERPLHVLTLSATTEPALRQSAERYLDEIKKSPDSIADICFTASTGRSHFDHRLAIVCSSRDEASQKLQSFLEGQKDRSVFTGKKEIDDKQSVAFLFTGQGSQYAGMGRELFETQPAFRHTMELCDQVLRPFLKRPLLEVIYPTDGNPASLNSTEYTQPALFALEYAMAQLWISWGITPSVLIGHSIGEYVAACVAGVFSLEDGLRLVAERARLMQALSTPGGMASVFASKDKVSPVVERYSRELSIAAINGPRQTVISGAMGALEQALTELKATGMVAQRLTVSHAFHSPLMQPMLDEFSKVAGSVELRKAKIGIASNVTGKISFDQISDADYWRRHILAPVDFVGGMNAVGQYGCDVFIEMGPKPTLISMAKQCITAGNKLWLASAEPDRSNWSTTLESLASLYVRGSSLDWLAFDRDYSRRRVSLPTYPFQRRRYWIEPVKNLPEATHPLLGKTIPNIGAPSGTHTWEVDLGDRSHAFLAGHQVFGNSVLPYAVYIEMAMAAAREAGSVCNQVKGLEIHRAVFIPENHSVKLQLVLKKESSGGITFRAFSHADPNGKQDQTWMLCASANLQADGASV